jgi:iron complex outermembrane receptor protein
MRIVLPRLAFILSLVSAALGADSTGTIEGRVSDPASAEFLERVRITVEGTPLETFTDTAGFYRVSGVPAGSARVRAAYTGLPPREATVTVSAGRTAVADFEFSRSGVRGGDVVKLAGYVVSTTREMEAAAIAINEQRYAADIRSVVSTDEFGAVAEGSVGEFLKFVPGISIEYEAGALARGISIHGVPSANVPVQVNGFNMASAGGNSVTSRSAQMDMTSITATSRIEVQYSPTPDAPGSALAGLVNMVPRSAFERSRPQLSLNTFVMMRDNARELRRTPGYFEQDTWKVLPGFDFSYIRPVTRNFGFTLSGGFSENGTKEDFIQNRWHGLNTATNGVAFPHTTPDRPYLTQTVMRDGTKNAARVSFGATFDWRFSPHDRLSFSYQHYYIDFLVLNRQITFSTNRVNPGDFNPFETRGAAGQGQLQLTNVFRDRTNSTFSPSLVWRHDGPVWKTEAGVGISIGRNTFRDIDKGYFVGSVAQRTGVTVNFGDIFYLRPRAITVTDAAGAPVDPYSIGSYAVTQTSANPLTNHDRQQGAYTNLGRTFALRLPVTVKAGLDVRRNEREARRGDYTWAFVGADGRGTTAPAGGDDIATPYFAPGYSRRDMPFGFPRVQWLDNEKLWSHYKANPGHLVFNENAAYRSDVLRSRATSEVISSAFVRGDLAALDRRLRLVGGIRAEQTNTLAFGPLNDPSLNYRRDAAGNVILTNGRPVPIVANTNSLEYSKLTYRDRGARAEKEYLRWFPSLNASYDLRENLIARAAYYHSIGRPSFEQYAGGLNLPDETSPPGPTNRISVNNAAIKPWTARSFSARLEYYFAGVGQVSLGGFVRQFRNFFGETTFPATPAFLSLYALDAEAFGAYDVATQHNIQSTVRMTGFDFSYKQALTFLPSWARGVQAFANFSSQRPTGEATANFQSYVPLKASWGVSLVRERFNLRANWSYQGRSRNGPVTGASIPAGTYNYTVRRVFVDLLGEYNLNRRLALYFTLRNVLDMPEQQEVDGPGVPQHATFRSAEFAGSLWTFGIKGTF